ncbi:flavodoxin domain-containing protein [Veronia pacifica]|uniref:NADPH--hemoprotein reductase n=1 Tax=Veronia pacifica TaxID=1080227 RepID=A0A1C3ER11_9GAMM|nr:sulfite reductase flavoprotein subunit alpha [Veronia pacifica]ODA35695.1 hypothetical protein A8L45_03535 [Veronia pacifica]
MQPVIRNIYVVYGSVSGNAKELARQLSSDSELANNFTITLKALDEFDPTELKDDTFTAFISSSFGDGEPPSNAEYFWQSFQEISQPLLFPFAVFGLGDTAYPNFCGFSKSLDSALSANGARRLINRVDADLSYRVLFEEWKTVLKAVLLKGDLRAGEALNISVSSYGENALFSAPLLSATKISGTFPSLYRIRICIKNSGIRYQPGDIVHLKPCNTEPLLTPFAYYFGVSVAEAERWLKEKEIARISKAVVRKIASAFPNSDLKSLLKYKNKVALNDYMKRHQFNDFLTDFYPEGTMTINEFADALSGIEPRTYSIASSQLANADVLELCVREVWSDPESTSPKPGCSTAYLQSLNIGDTLPLFVRANPGFHYDVNSPSILIATGAGIAPFIGYLQSREKHQSSAPCILFFGEKHQSVDYVYRDEIKHWLDSGVLQNCFVAFSRDQETKHYVQDSVRQQHAAVRELIDMGAKVYVCGRKQNLASQIEPMLNALSIDNSEDNSGTYKMLVEQNRLHLDLF